MKKMKGKKARTLRKAKSARKTIKATEKAVPLVPVEAWEQISGFQSRCSRLEGDALRLLCLQEHERLFGGAAPLEVSTQLIKVKVGYELQRLGFEKAGVPLSAKVQSRIEAAAKFDVTEFDDNFRQLLEVQDGIGGTMGKKKVAKKRDGKTIAALVIEIMRRKVVPTNDAVVGLVQKAFPGSAFNDKHFAWYKNRFKNGALASQTKKETLNQPDTGSSRGRPAKKEKRVAKKTPKKGKAKKVTIRKKKAA